MASCKTVERLYAAVPLRPFRDWLIRVHMEGCPGCQARLLSRDEARRLLVGPDQAGDSGELWRRISGKVFRADPAGPARPAVVSFVRRWASVAVMTAAVVLAGFWMLREAGRPPRAAAAIGMSGPFEIAYVRVGGVPAQTFVYQPLGSDTVFIWASKAP